jgi:hypothetical protein
MNTIFIGQTPGQTRLSADLIQSSNLQQIRLVRSKLALAESIADQPAPLAVTFSFGATKETSPAGILRLNVAFQMVGLPEDSSGTETTSPPEGPVVEVDCAFRLDYDLRPGFQPTDAQIEAFKDGNAIFNAWPYFREYLQSTFQRMGLPPFTLPFLRLHPKPSPPKADAQIAPPVPASSHPKASPVSGKKTLSRRS